MRAKNGLQRLIILGKGFHTQRQQYFINTIVAAPARTKRAWSRPLSYPRAFTVALQSRVAKEAMHDRREKNTYVRLLSPVHCFAGAVGEAPCRHQPHTQTPHEPRLRARVSCLGTSIEAGTQHCIRSVHTFQSSPKSAAQPEHAFSRPRRRHRRNHTQGPRAPGTSVASRACRG